MIITNSVLSVKGEFQNKDDIKKYIYSFIENHPFKKYNKKIADKYGENMFSMTFIKPNIIVLTQKYMTMQEYNEATILRNHLIDDIVPSLVDSYKVSEPFEVYYD